MKIYLYNWHGKSREKNMTPSHMIIVITNGLPECQRWYSVVKYKFKKRRALYHSLLSHLRNFEVMV